MNATGEGAIAVPQSARRVSDAWRRLAAPRADGRVFQAEMADGLPEPARRWLLWAVEPGTAITTTAVVSMSGEIRIGVWRAFNARQVIAAGTGYIWAASARFGRLPVLGYDRYSDGSAEMRWRLAGIIPVMSASGEDVRRSAAGRLASELFLTPAAALSPFVRWEPVDEERARAVVLVDGVEHVVTIEVDAAGALCCVRLRRWGDPNGHGYAEHEFVGRCTGELRCAGYQLPARIQAGWDLGDSGEPSIEFDIHTAAFV